jgi:hypothetical protein
VSAGSQASVPLWAVPKIGHPSAGIDTLGTFFFLPFATCLGCTRAVLIERGRGRLSPLRREDTGSWLRRLPDGRVKRGAVVGGLCIAVLSPVAVLVFLVADVGHLTTTSFVVYKAILGVVFGAIVTPFIAVRAMADPLPIDSVPAS